MLSRSQQIKSSSDLPSLMCAEYETNADTHHLGSCKNKVFHPATIELALRKTISDNLGKSIFPIRLAIMAAQLHGNNWFSIAEVSTALIGTSRGQSSRDNAISLANLGIAETRDHLEGKQLIVQARITARLFASDHLHAIAAIRLAYDINRYYKAKPHASALPALLLVGIHIQKLQDYSDLRDFCEPDYKFVRGCAAFFKIIHVLNNAGMVILARERPSSRGNTSIIPIETLS